MNAAEMLVEEAKKLPEETAQEVLDFLKRLRAKQHQAFVEECKESKANYQAGNYQRGSVADFLKALDDD